MKIDWDKEYKHAITYLRKNRFAIKFPHLYDDCLQYMLMKRFEAIEATGFKGDYKWYLIDFLRKEGLGPRGKKSVSCLKYVGEKEDYLLDLNTDEPEIIEKRCLYAKFIQSFKISKETYLWAIRNYKKCRQEEMI